jgi:hypothetical protein
MRKLHDQIILNFGSILLHVQLKHTISIVMFRPIRRKVRQHFVRYCYPFVSELINGFCLVNHGMKNQYVCQQVIKLNDLALVKPHIIANDTIITKAQPPCVAIDETSDRRFKCEVQHMVK